MPEEDLFNEAPAKPAPKAPPKPKASDEDNLFDEAPAKPAAPPRPAAPKKADDVDNLFEPNDNAPPKPPAKKPADSDDLFNDAPPNRGAAKEAMPAEPAADVPAAEAPAPAEPAAKPAAKLAADDDDLFSEPPAAEKKAAQPAPKKAPADDDDLFSDPQDKPSRDNAGKSADAATTRSNPVLVFRPAPPVAPATAPAKQLAAKPSATESPAAAYRTWTDDTGKFQVRARLVVVLEGKVRLLKDSGRFTLVPFERLSAADLHFILQQAQFSATEGTQKTASAY